MSRVKVYSNEHFAQLRGLHDEALEASHFEGARRQLGRISIGSVTALWRAESGGNAWLAETGIRFGELFPTITPRLGPPSRLWIYGENSDEDGAVELTEFSMNLHPRNGFVEVRRTIYDYNDSNRAVKTFDHTRTAARERKLGLANPTTEDWELLHDELRRGASGAYALKGVYDG